ncbi:hypothetical protein SEPCBS57363_002140 [Sporothrix epigloea]|uniref:Uncharacterized protein n=1 Tax=Sporothrix epigloea TaxID=1892477 RepID=A0ABP0DE90_9PEZI
MQTRLYRAIMTPIIFVSFIFSLAWVEFRYSMLRSHYHVKPLPDHKTDGSDRKDTDNTSVNGNKRLPTCYHRHMPKWLHSIIYRRQPCQYVPVEEDDSQHAEATSVPSTRSADNGTYYHSMQRKLLKMESEEAFRIRTTVLGVVIVAALGSAWVSVAAMRWLASYIWVSL